MSTDLKCATVAGSGILVDVATSTTIGETRIRSIVARTGSAGEYVIESTNALGKVSRIKFPVASEISMDFTDCGIRMYGTIVSVVAPASASFLTVMYG